ncbi:GlsB/YeaQ/YmgE family stress response membrane protein [Nitrosomonas eutropha]|uniref:GlsB/YeaQ/YmgE family stress response membrane protein n=1 Tax=Nitrosomonas eutropha TaxID=916 RepID=UPI00032190D9|nr:GlsB/YeaQ/YmgE family stress response membrane protein [Nitrosomonas eutropha]
MLIKPEEKLVDYTGLIIFIAIGAIAGWLAGILMKGRGFGLMGNIIIGIVGAIAGGLLFGLLGLIGSIVTAIVGSAVLLFLAWVITKSKNPS